MQLALWYRGSKSPAPWILLVLRKFLNLYKSLVNSCLIVYKVFYILSCVIRGNITNIDIVRIKGTIDIHCTIDCRGVAAAAAAAVNF